MVVLSTMDILTLVTLWVFSFLCLVLIIVRLAWRYRRGESFFSDDLWMALSIAPLTMRVAFIHMTLVFMTSAFDHNAIPESSMSSLEKSHRILGSKLVLPGRICYAAFVWCMKACLLHFLARLTKRAKPYGYIIDVLWGVVGLSFIAVCLATFLECRPFKLYWQLYPDPGRCVHAQIQLLVMGLANIATDVALVVIPLPLIFKSTLPLLRKVQLVFLFGVSFFVIAITIARLPIIIDNNDMQQFRSLWANVECLAACIVANAPVINSFLQKARHHSDHEHYDHNLSPAENRRRRRRRMHMPVTGEDSLGSLTRGDVVDTAIETRTEIVTKIHDDPELSVYKSKPLRSPWRGDFLGTSIWTPVDFPEIPPLAKIKPKTKKEPRTELFYPGIHDPRRPGDTIPLERLDD